jgi:beta-lactamase class A
MAKRKRIWKINPAFTLLISFTLSFVILWYTKSTNPVKDTYDNLLSSESVRGSLFGKIIERISSQEQPSERINDKYSSLMKFIKKQQGNYSLYIKDLSSGLTYGYNENVEYYGASIFKTPLAIAAFHQIQEGNLTENQQIVYTPSDFYGGSGIIQTKPYGTTFTLLYLVEVLLKNSDNIAQNMIRRTVGEKALAESFSVNIPLENSKFFEQNITSSKEMGIFFENVITKSYLNDNSLEKLFEIMSKTSFDDRISNHLNKNLTFSHKIGNWGSEGSWHDCGIVFGPKDLVVCVMSKDTKYESFLETCKKVAEFINYYSEIS